MLVQSGSTVQHAVNSLHTQVAFDIIADFMKPIGHSSVRNVAGVLPAWVN